MSEEGGALVPAGYSGPTTLEQTDAFQQTHGGPTVRSQDAALPAKVASDWDSAGGIEYHGRIAAELLNAATAGSDLSSFDSLPQATQNVVLSFMGLPRDARPATVDEIEDFGETPVGRALVGEWGGRASRRLGRANAFINGVCRACPDGGQALMGWFRNLPARDQANIVRALAE